MYFGYAYHDRNTYTEEKLKDLNEAAYGFGLARGYINENGNYEGVYAAIFLDSHSDPQYNVGYLWQYLKHFRVGDVPSSVGIGYTAAIAARQDIYGGVPVPVVFPVGSFSMGRFSILGTFIPKLGGGINHGNVVLLFAKMTLD